LHAPVIFAGGVAHNPCVRDLLSRTLGTAMSVPEHPAMFGALGAALHGIRLSR
jgi:activator of 2-hydroxyglutaryl-CoA dehydratase